MINNILDCYSAKKKSILGAVVFIPCLLFGVWHEYVSFHISDTGYYKGTVVDKATSGNGEATHYLYVNWDGIGEDSVVVHPVTYKRTRIGDRFETEYTYLPGIGAAGMAYNPNTDEYGIMFALVGILSKIISIGLLITVIRATNEQNRNVAG